MTTGRRTAPLLAALLLAAVAGAVVALAAVRADRLQEQGRATTATVVAQDARGKSWLAVVEYRDADGRTRRGEVRIGRWVDPYDGYAVGDEVEVRHDRDDPADLRTARDWNTPGALWATGVVAGCGSALAGVLALLQGRRRP